MNILVLGNGFDLAHELDTRYIDFLKYFQLKKSKNIKYLQNLWLQHFTNRQNDLGDTWIDLEMEIYDVLVNLVSNKDLMNFLKIGSIKFELKNDFKNFKFENFHKNIQNYSKTNIYNNHYEILSEKYKNKDTLSVCIENEEGLANFLYYQLRIFTKFFEDYLLDITQKEIHNKYKLSLQSIGITPGDKDVHVLNFNYTNTCEKFYTGKFRDYSNIKFIPIYIHGNIVNNDNIEKCKLILGTHSFSSPEYKNKNIDIPVYFNIFQKHNQRHKYGTIEKYQDFVKKIISVREHNNGNSIKIHVIGHSLDKTDHNILNHIFNIDKYAIINIYYNNEKTQEKLINNITDIIGENDVMTRVRFIHQHNEERSILKFKKDNV